MMLRRFALRLRPVLKHPIAAASMVTVGILVLAVGLVTDGGTDGSNDVPAATDELMVDRAPFFISVLADGRILMEQTAVTLEELEAGLALLREAGTVERVYIRADSLAPYGSALRIITTTVSSGMPWSIIAEPYSRES